MILCASPAEQYQGHRAEIDRVVLEVLAKGWYVLGENVTRFEEEFTRYLGAPVETVGVGSGTEALHLALAAAGIGAGDEVITVGHTAVATVAAIELTGAKAVIVDIEEGTYTLDPKCLKDAINSRSKAIIAVHIYGLPVDMEAISNFARQHKLLLIEDCAQATGARYNGKQVGSMGDFGCFSFYPTKNLGAIGDGGAVTARDPKLAKRVRNLRQYGWEERYISSIAGWNSRLDEIQAAVLRVKLPHLDKDNERRRRLASLYNQGLSGLSLKLPSTRAGSEHVYHLYVIESDKRDSLQAHLKKREIQSMVHYPMPVHLQPAYKGRIGVSGSLKATERAATKVLSLPMYPELSEASVEKVIAAVKEFFQ